MRRPIVGVLGGGRGSVSHSDPAYTLAVEVGRLVAKAGAILMCGGGGGIMEAAAKGAHAEGGKSIAVMPTRDNQEGAPNQYMDAAVYTGLGDGRNYLTAGIPDAAIAMKGEAGTLSEIGLALKLQTPIVLLDAWEFLTEHFPRAVFTRDASEAVRLSLGALRLRDGLLDAAVKERAMPAQDETMKELSRIVAELSK